MTLAVISDIHANLHALEAVWEDIEMQRPDAVYCLGDLVGYGGYPNDVINFLTERKVPAVKGNYDEGVGFDLDDCGCVYKDPELERLGNLSLIWSREVTSPDNKIYLQSMPKQIRLEEQGFSLLLVHGSPRKINEYVFEDRPQATFERIAKEANSDVLLFGHTHIPYTKTISNTLFVNTGTVGKPKDGDPRAGYVVLTLADRPRAEYRRVPYDVEAAAKAVRDSDLPDYYAESLETGRS